MVITDKGLDNLRCAIVQQAAYDYLDCRKHLHKLKYLDSDYAYRARKFATGRFAEIKKWFKSDYYTLLCSIDGDKMLRYLDKEYKDWAIKYDSIKQETNDDEKKKQRKSLYNRDYKKKKIILA